MPEVPVNHDPFAPREVPVEGNPFAEAGPLTQFAGGVNATLAPPMRSLERGAQMVGMSEPGAVAAGAYRPESITSPVADWLASGVPSPKTSAQRISRRAGEIFGETIPYAMTMFMGAPAVAAVQKSTGLTKAGALKNAVIDMAAGIKNAPIVAGIGEAVSTLGAGFGGGAAHEAFGAGAEPYGQLAGGVAPIGLGYTPAGLAIRAFKAGVSRFSPQAQTQRSKQAVSEAIGPGLSVEARERLREGQKLRQEIPGFEPSLAETTGSPALVATQRALEGQAQGARLENFAGRRAENVAAVDQYAQQQAPAGFTPEYVVDTAGQRITDLSGDIAARQTGAMGMAESLANRMPSARRDMTGEGAAIREKYTKLRDDKRTEMDALAEELKLNDIDLTGPFEGYRTFTKELLGERSWLSDPEGIPKGATRVTRVAGKAETPAGMKSFYEKYPVLKGAQEKQKPTKFTDVMAFRSALESEKRDAISGAVPNADRARQLTLMVGQLDNWLDDALKTAAPETKSAYDTFRQRYREEYVDRFNQGAAFKVRARDGRGFYQTQDEDIAALFTKNAASAQQFKRTFGENAPERRSVQNVLLDDLRDSALRDGTLDPKAVIRWRQQNADVLKEFPEADAATVSLEKSLRSLSARNADLAAREKRVQDSLLGRYMQSYTKGTASADAVIESAIKTPTLMGQITGGLRKNPDAMSALRRSVWDKLRPLPPEQLRAALEMPSVKSVFEPQHVKALQNISKASEFIAEVPAPTGRGLDPNMLADVERNLGSGVNQIMSRIFAAQSGRTSYRFIMGDLIARYVRGQNQKQMGQLFEQALYDPEVAKSLADYIYIPMKRAPSAKRLNAWLFSVGAEPDDEDKESP